GVKVRTTWILQSKSVAELAILCDNAGQEDSGKQEESLAGPVGDSAIIKFFKQLDLPKPMHFNQSVLLRLEEDINLKLLESAINALVRNHDILRAVWKDEGLIVENKDTSLQLEEYSAATEKEITDICSSLKGSFEEGASLIRAAVINHNENTDTAKRFLFLTAHHTIVDGVSWRIILDDLQDAYHQLKENRQAVLPKESISYADYVNAQKDYADSYALSLEIPYWRRVQEQIPGLSDTKTDDYTRVFGLFEENLESDATAAFLAAPFDRIKGTVEDGLLTAVCLALFKHKGINNLSVRMEGHGREEFVKGLLTEQTVGWFTSVYPVVIENITEDLFQDLLTVKECIHRVPQRGVGYGILQYLSDSLSEHDPIPQVSFNYLGVMEAGIRNGVFAFETGIDTGRDMAAENTFGCALSINCMVASGHFTLRLEYDKANFTDIEIKELASDVFENMGLLVSLLKKETGKTVTASDLGETKWSQEEFDSVYRKYRSKGEDIQRIYPLTSMQEAMLLKAISEPDSDSYKMAYIYELDKALTAKEAEKALDRLADKYEVLRTAISYRNVSEPRQMILKRKPFLVMKDIRGALDPEKEILRIREEVLKDGFDLENKPLFGLIVVRKTDDSCYIIMSVHHIIIDGWSLRPLVSDLSRFLLEESAEEQVITDSDSRSMDGIYERAVRESLLLDHKKGLKYFKNLLDGYDSLAEIPSFGEVPLTERSDTNEVILTIDKESTDDLLKLCKLAKVTISNAVELAWGRVLSVYSRQPDVVFAKTVSGRDKTVEDVTDIVGLFIRSVPVRIVFTEDKNTIQMLLEIREQASSTNEYDYCAMSEIQEQTDHGSRLFQSILTFENYNSGLDDADISSDRKNALKVILIKDENFDDISPVSYVDDKGQLTFKLLFDTRKYRKDEMNRCLKLFRLTVSQMVKNPEKPLLKMPVLDKQEEKEIIAFSKSEDLDYDRNSTWISVFNRAVRNYPKNTAVVDDSGSLTYEELDSQSDALCAYLSDHNVKPGDFVALKMPHVKEFITAVIGIHKAGAAYVPIDTEYPSDRISFMLKDCEAVLTLDDITVKEAVAAYEGRSSKDLSKPDQIAYMIYTSGSTGHPKGVMFLQSGLMNCASAIVLENELRSTDRIGLHFSFSFDSHIEDTYPPLMSGAAIYMMPENIRKDPDAIYRFLEENAITGCGFTTSLARLMIENYDLHLRYISPMGEALTEVRSDTVRILNKYGPTECCICSVYELEKSRNYKDVPIGRALPNSYIFIVDEKGHLLPKGMAGELCYAGPQVGAGYWKQEEMTGRVFTDCPFVSGIKMYHTGDLARYDEDGNLWFLGRIDLQVKVNGYRVEISEIESCALQNETIYEAAAVVRDNRIHLFYTVKGNGISPEEIKSKMSSFLPGYMVPEGFFELDSMPHTPSGKIDRKALTVPKEHISEDVILPRTPMEKLVHSVCLELLHGESISVTENLISCGLSSIGAMRLGIMLSGRTGSHVDITGIMRSPTIESIAAMLTKPQEDVHIQRYQERRYYPLASNQLAIYLEWDKDRLSTKYNVPYLYILEGIDAEAFKRAVLEAVSVHPYLNNRFILRDAEPVQMPGDEAITVPLERLTKEPDMAFFQNMVRPFDLLGECLSRFGIYSFENNTYFFIDIHHSIYDGLSMTILMQDILKAYKGESLLSETVSSYDAALYEKERLGKELSFSAREFFDAQLRDGESAVFPESEEKDDFYQRQKPGQETLRIDRKNIDSFCKESGVTASGFLQAAFAEALYRYTGAENPVYLTVTNGREDEALERTVGMFIRTVPVSCGIKNRQSMSAADYVKEMHGRLQDIYAFGYYPWSKLTSEYKISPEIMFVYQDDIFEGGQLNGSRQIPLLLDSLKYPICLTAFPEGDDYVLYFEYDGNKYNKKDIQAFGNSIRCIAEGLSENRKLKDCKNLDPEEEKEIITISTGDDLQFDSSKTWVDLFKENAEIYPDDIAVVDSTGRNTYKELDIQSDKVAAFLIASGVKEDDFVAVKMGRIKEFVAAILGINKAGAAYVPVDPTYPEDRITYMLKDSEAKYVLTDENIFKILKDVSVESSLVSRAKAENKAYMIYTSGTTGRPKGAMILHRGLSAFVAWNNQELKQGHGSKHLIHSSFSFDASVFDMICPLAVGATVHIAGEELRRDLFGLARYINENKITGMLLNTQVGMELIGHYDLNIRYMMLGGDKMLPLRDTNYNVYNAYGPTEFTAASSFYKVSGGEKTVPIGRPVPGSISIICDRYGNLLPKGVAGELCVAGIQMGAGYFNQPLLTAEKFVNLEIPGTGETTVFRTGDLARYNKEGNLQFLGRIDDQIKLRGYRIELGEIENTAASYKDITGVAALVKNDSIVLYYTSDKEVDEQELRSFLGKKLPEYMVPEIYMELKAIPLRENGKIDRDALPDPLLNDAIVLQEPETELESKLLEITKALLGEDGYGVTSNLIRMGLSSLGAMRLSSQIQRKLGRTLRVSDILKNPTIREMAKHLETKGGAENDNSGHIKIYEKRQYYPITENQWGLYIEWELHNNTLQYNDPEVYILKDRSINEVEAAVRSVINAHSYLKVHLTLIDGEVMQKRNDEDEIIVGKEKLSYEPDESFFKGKVRPFDLLNDTLYRIELTEYQNSVFLFMDIHHIISDGLTVSMFMQEVVKALDGKEISQEEITAYDFALDEEEWGQSYEFVKAQEYFDSILEGAEPAKLPGSDTPEGFGIGVIRTAAPKDKIDAFLRANNVTAASYLQAAFAETLYRLLRTENLFYVTISNGRSGDARLDHAAGMFVKTIPVVRSEDKLKDASLTSDYVKAIHRQLGASFENERYPYTRMVDRSGLHADILFSYQGGIYDELIKDESVSGHITVERDTARFPIEVLSAEMNDEYIFELSYDRSIYSRQDMEMFCAAVANAAKELAELKHRTDLSLADTREREKLLRLGEGPKLYVDPEETIVSMFRDRAAKKPDDKALVYKDKSYTYGEIDTITDYLASYLVREANVRSGDVVGVLIERSEYMLIYPMAIMKAGAAYMPLDPSFPAERLMFMCEDASVKVILTDNGIANRVIPDYEGTVIERGSIENARDLTITGRGYNLPKVSAKDPMVVLYTSGSTGQPKGVTLLHSGIVNFMHWYVKEYDVTEKDRSGAYAAFGFDAHMIDLYSSMLAGACVYIISEELRKDLQGLNRYYKDNGITISFMTTQVGCLFSEMNKTLRVLTTGGEKMPPVKNPGYRLINGYGPTECSIYTTTYEVKDAFDGKYIGRPLPNYQLYVTDPCGKLIPEGAGGELLISGVGVGAGYLNSPELTKEKFISLLIDGRSAPIRAYRTGDLVRWSENGNLEFLGRLDNQVKLRGLRIELGEIENRASMFEGINSCVASVINDVIVLYYTSDTEVDKEALVEFLGRKLADYMVPQTFVHMDTMPMGTNGKIDRSALPEPESDSLDYIDIPETRLQKEIQKLVSSIIKTENPGVNSNLIRMGMSSLGAMRLSVLLQKELGVTLKMSDILSDPTIKGIAARLEDEEKCSSETIRAYEKREYYPITENQRGIYLDWELNRDTLQYNLPILYLMKGQDIGRLADAIEKALNAHSYLKTRFVFYDGDVMQKRCDDEACVIYKESLSFKPDKDYFLQKVRPFNLLEDSLYRIELSEYQDTVYLFMDMHHIVFDGLSSKIFMNDIMLVLEGTIPESESVTAYDYALYEKELEKRASYKEAHEYFAKLIMDAHVMSYPNSVKPDGGGQGSVITDIDSKPVEEAGRKYEVTAGAFLQAAFAETISRFMWEENPLYLTISNGRNGLTNMDRTVGMFVKTVPAVYKSMGSDGERSIRDYVNEFQDQLQQTYRREFYPYTKLVEESDLRGEILFVYQGGIREGSEMGGAEVIDFEFDAEKFPLQVTVYPQDDRYVFRLDYDGNRYSKEDMELLAGAIKEVALSMAAGETFKDIRMVSTGEEQEVLLRSKGEDMEYDKTITWLDLLSEAIAKYPDRIAVVDDRREVTYKELESGSNAVAAYLIDKGVQPGEFVAMQMDRWAENIIAIVGIHKAGGAYAPVDLNYPQERQQYMLENSDARVILTEEVMSDVLKSYNGAQPINRAVPKGNAYIIYTSGSTGRPKGTILHHAGIVNFTLATAKMNELTCEDRICLHSSFSFDAHTEDLFPPLIAGASIHIMPESVRKDPDLIYRYLVDHKITGGAFTTSLGRLLAMNYNLPQRFIALMGEALTEITPGDTTVINKYGFTECTNISTYYFLEKGKNYDRAPIGYTMPNGYSLILDPKGALVPFGGIGEICYAGPQTGYGYYKLDERTAKVFTDCQWLPGVRLYHSGDLGRYNEDGILEYIGRMDHQVKVHGYRVEFGEIESAALRFEGVYEAAAAVKQGRVVLYYTEKTDADGNIAVHVDEKCLRDFMSKTLAEFLMPEVFVRLDDMPRSPSRKVDRKALPEPAKDDVGEIIAPETELEKKLFDITARQLETDKFGITTSLISLGLSSLGIMRLSMTINQELGVAPLVRDMMTDPTIRGIASHLEEGFKDKESKTNSIGTYEKREYYPITENQRGLYIDWELNENTLQYNVPVVYIFKGRSITELENAINAVMDAHSYLKMHLAIVDGELMQKRCDEDIVIIKKEVLGNEPTKDYFQKKVRPFKLLEDNLYRIELSEYKDTVYLFMDMHHIIFDGLTGSLFIDELQKELDGSSVPKEEITAFDFALFEREQTASEEFTEAAGYFEDLLKGAEAAYIEKSDEPDGKTLGIADTYLSGKEIDEFCKANDVTPASFFEAAFAETLYRMTREEKLAYVTVSNGRSADARLERTAGMFVKTIPVVRNEEELKGATLSADYVKSIHRQLQSSFTREHYPYTRIVEKNGIHARILFTYQGDIFDESVTNEETIGHFDMELDTAKFPVEVFVCPVNEKYLIHISYDGRMYGHKDMQLLAGAIANAASELAIYEERSCISLADRSMRLMLKELGEGSKMALDSGETIVSMFRRRASETPDAPAVVYNGRSFTYGELDALTDALALTLVTENSVNPGDIVGVLIHRSEYMLIYPLAIMKAGAAYMPLDPGFPSERLQFMCEDANVKLILTESGLGKDLLPEFKGIVFDRGNSDISAGLKKKDNTHNAEITGLPEVSAKDAMVILYTSGSTGLPKAVALPHKGIVNFMHWYVNEYEVSEKDRAGAYANFGFDAHMIDLYSSVLAGACVYIIPDEMRMNLSEINRYYEENSITISFMTTQVACIFSEMNKSLRVLTTGGEKMPQVKNPGYRLINGYGPTECSIYTTTYEVNGEFDGKYIGRPISNYQVFVADCEGKLLPRGFAGELVISGAGVGDGYLNRPELTDEKFILFKTDINAAPVRAYRTGDLVRWSEDGNLEFLGRLDNQVKLSGLRIELGEIESRAASYEGIKRAAAAVNDDTIVLYYTCENKIDEEELKSFLGRMLTDYMVPQIYVHMDTMPTNANGKIDRPGLPKPLITEGKELIKPSTELEEKLFDLIGSHFANCEFGVTTSLIRMGLTSLGAMRLSVLMQKELGRTLKMSEILSAPTIRAMAERLEAKDSQEKGSIKIQKLRDHYPITENQKGLYIDWELHRDTLQYNVPVVYVFKGRRLQEVSDALKAVFEAHKYLMTRFGIVDGSVCQIPASAEAGRSIDISVTELDSEPQREYFQKKVRPFDLIS
ncbi:non-ribosomal peptide synthetase, partial [Butyrivibrio sp.]|uniref:non-ribosomal peptide synthetase n=1 Tax=Butyrivibrio sp. TaxID=28121 RepID=UPI0025B91CCA